MIEKLVEFSMNRPRAVIIALTLMSLAFAAGFPRIKTDTDPKNMLPPTAAVRQFNDEVDKKFGLHPDTIVLGIVNEKGLFNRETLTNIKRITNEVLLLDGVITRDVISFVTVDDVKSGGGLLESGPLLDKVPESVEQMREFRRSIYSNPLLVDRLVSRDGTTTAVYIPIEKKANGKAIAEKIKKIVAAHSRTEKYYLAGDPIARDTFGAEMFRQMGLFSPLAGMVMFIVLLLMFRSLGLVAANMGAAMIAIIWSMGGMIWLGVPVHIMASMSPVFLMAIATDTVHIFNEFYFRYKETGNRRDAIRETMRAVASPIIFSDLTTAVGFASLAIGPIIPVKVFGFVVAFGTLVILLMSFTLVPAILSLLSEKKLAALCSKMQIETQSPVLERIGSFAVSRSKAVLVVGAAILIVSVVGITKIHINNNMITWFRAQSDIRKAEKVVNEKLGGSAMAYIVAEGKEQDTFKNPKNLAYLDDLQKEISELKHVGKAVSIADYVKRVNRVLHDDDPQYEKIPGTREEVSQFLEIFRMAAKARDIDNVVDYPFRSANMMIQLKTWDASAMSGVIRQVDDYSKRHPNKDLSFKPAGISYFNLVWNHEVLWGMLSGFIMASVMVLILLVIDYRSLKWGLISFIPFLFTILCIYGAVGFIGKDFDMPISVLSTLSLGLAIDFAIHFVSRYRQRLKEEPDARAALIWTAVRPGRGIMRNAVLFASGFSVMIFASLTPYITVGIFMIAIMLLSAVASIVLLPALIKTFSMR